MPGEESFLAVQAHLFEGGQMVNARDSELLVAFFIVADYLCAGNF